MRDITTVLVIFVIRLGPAVDQMSQCLFVSFVLVCFVLFIGTCIVCIVFPFQIDNSPGKSIFSKMACLVWERKHTNV